MNIFVVIADCLTRNSSANLCHLAYIRGLLDAGHQVSILSADGKAYIQDSNMKIPQQAISHTIYGVSLYEKLSLKKTGTNPHKNISAPSITAKKGSRKIGIIRKIKDAFLSCYGAHGIYSTFVRKALCFSSDENFDVVISISTPPASHLVAHNLIKRRQIKASHWIQIWEDPWYSDAYGFNAKKSIYKEEKRLLQMAEKVCYVSPLTLRKQQEIYPESASKMYWQPLPSYYCSDKEVILDERDHYGYFGDYVPAARDLHPFYLAAKQEGLNVTICGNPFNLFEPTDKISIYPRLPLTELKKHEDKANILIFLCNKQGGQIPGKIYQYSATHKKILFILDGTEEEKAVLRNYFGQFNRYVFCDNTVEDIVRAIKLIKSDQLNGISSIPLDHFEPTKIVEKILGMDEEIV